MPAGIYRRLDGCEACILGADDRAIITITTRASKARQRFSLGHELGHWHYHRGRSSICRPDDIANQTRSPLDRERIADGYAADLLLPRYLFEPRLIGAVRPSFTTVERLGPEFRTSITAAPELLLQELGVTEPNDIAHRQLNDAKEATV